MAIKFLNIKTKEVRVAREEPQIAALWASSDRSPNITQGQDFGWRLAPEVVVEMEDLKKDVSMIQRIAALQGRPMEDIGEKEILTYISSQTTETQAPVADAEDYEDDYRAAITAARKRKHGEPKVAVTAPTVEKPLENDDPGEPAVDEDFDASITEAPTTPPVNPTDKDE